MSLDPYRLAAQTQVVRVVAMVAAKVGVEARRERILAEMARDLRGKKAKSNDPMSGFGRPRRSSGLVTEPYRAVDPIGLLHPQPLPY
jgi:hypothetical protein